MAGCFGFEVDSALTLRFARRGTGETELRVVEAEPIVPEPATKPLVAWEANEERPAARLHGIGTSAYGLWIDGVGWYGIDPATATIAVPPGGDPVRREERLWAIPALVAYIARGDHSLHAAVVEVDDGALVLAAPGRHGKTTLAAAFLAAGFRVLTEDLCCFRPGQPGATPHVFPGPAVLRVRRDAYDHLAIDGATVVAEDAFRVHLELDDHRRGDGAPVPIRGIALLRTSADGWAIDRVPTQLALRELWPLSFQLPDDDSWAASFSALAGLVGAVPVWSVERPLSWATLDRAVDTLADLAVSPAARSA